MPQLLQLTKNERNNLKILYLAKLAPLSFDNPEPSYDQEEGVVPVYHHNLFKSLVELELDVTPSRHIDHLLIQNRSYNYVFSILNRARFRNSEILVSSVCEYLQIAYLGARPHARSLAEDKHLTKTLALTLGIETANWSLYRTGEAIDMPPHFPGPFFVKPRFGAASETIDADSIQDDWPALRKRICVLHDQGLDVIVEKFIDGENVTIPVINAANPVVLPCVEDITDAPGGILTYRLNRLLEPGMKRRSFHEEKPVQAMTTAAKSILPHISPVDYFRIDFRVEKITRTPYLLEINICCNLGQHSNIAIPAAEIGIEYSDLLEHILAFSTRRQHLFCN